MQSGFSRTRVRFRYCASWILAAAMILFVGHAMAQGFEEIPVPANHHPAGSSPRSIQTERVVPQQLPGIVSPDDYAVAQSPTGIAFASGTEQPSGGVVPAQYHNGTGQSSGQVVLPSIQLVQGTILQSNVPRLASVDKKPAATSTYPGAGQIMMQESDGTTPTVTARPSSRSLQEISPPPPSVTQSQKPSQNGGVVNIYSQGEEIAWDSQENYESYEVLPRQLGRVSNYGAEYAVPGQYGMQGNSYAGGYYSDGMYVGNNYYPYGQEVYGAMASGQSMYGYGYGNYPGACPPGYYSHGLMTAAFSHIMYSNVWENLTVGFGGSSFGSPLGLAYGGDNGGAFGFNETLNWASPSTSMMPISLQAGVRAVQAFPSGYYDTWKSSWRRDTREQYFGTIGVFRRNIGCTPFNFGVAYDMMSDKYYAEYNLEQLRAELSYGGLYGVEFGYRGAYSLRGDSISIAGQTRFGVRTVDYHTLFLKKYFANGGEGSLAGGATEYGDFMVRAEYNIPLSNEWGLKNSLSYVVPKGGHNPSSPMRESWDVSLQLVYQPRGGVLAGFCNPFRALFDVADNGTMLQRRR